MACTQFSLVLSNETLYTVKPFTFLPKLADLYLVFARMSKYGLKTNPLLCAFGVSLVENRPLVAGPEGLSSRFWTRDERVGTRGGGPLVPGVHDPRPKCLHVGSAARTSPGNTNRDQRVSAFFLIYFSFVFLFAFCFFFFH